MERREISIGITNKTNLSQEISSASVRGEKDRRMIITSSWFLVMVKIVGTIILTRQLLNMSNQELSCNKDSSKTLGSVA